MPGYPFSQLPSISGSRAVKAFEKLGWRIHRYHGGHAIMVKDDSEAILTVPQHDELAKGTLKSILMAGEIALDDFKNAI